MIIAIITLITSLAIAGIAAWYSITGLAAIFASAVLPIMIMGAALEVGKLVTASWLYRNWKETPLLLKSYLTLAVVILMLITSMGIFGFLSKAHLDQTIQVGGNSEILISNYERQIAIEQRKIADAEVVTAQLDQAVQVLMDYDRIRGKDGAIAVRKSQAEERSALSAQINSSVSEVNRITNEILPLKKLQVELEAEVGPLKYISELIYGEEQAKSHFDEAVRWVIILIIFVFDPLAVLLLIAANQSFAQRKTKEVDETDDIMILDHPSDSLIDERPEDKLFTATGEDLASTFNEYPEDESPEDTHTPETYFEMSDDIDLDPTEVIETIYEDPDEHLGEVAKVPYNVYRGLIDSA